MIYKFLLLFLLPMALFGGFGKFLTPQEAFQPEVHVENGKIKATVILGEQIYIYKDKVHFKIKNNDALKIANIDAPEPIKHDEDLVYEGAPTFTLTLDNPSGADGVQKFQLEFSFQGCSARGICYEPITKSFPLTIDTSTLQNTQKNSVSTPTQQTGSEVDSIASTLKNGNILVILATFFGFGLLLALTPCVFPMIPIISGLIISQGKNITTQKAFFLSLVYVLSMAVAYTIAGVLAGLFGSNLQATLQNPYVVVSFALIFVALAMSMFGYYELKLPDKFVASVSAKGQDKGGIIGVAVMGFLSALIVGPCVAAPLAGALVYIGQTGDALLGGMALFSMSLGMGVPLIIVGTGAGKFMPKPGAWMTLINAIFGIIMLGVAIWMLDKILDPSIIMLLWALLTLGSALYLGAFEKESHIFKRTIAMTLFLYAIALFSGVFAGHTSLKEPLGFLQQRSTTSTTAQENELQFLVVKDLNQLNALVEQNKGKKILIDFSAKWCTACKELEEITFKDQSIKTALKEFVLIRADVTENSPEQKAMSKKFGVFGPPVLLFINEDGKLLDDKTIVGYLPPEEFLQTLQSL